MNLTASTSYSAALGFRRFIVPLWIAVGIVSCSVNAHALQTVTLPSGDYLIVDPQYDAPGPILDVGAVTLHSGTTGAIVGVLTGSTTNDQVGSGGITIIGTNAYVIRSPLWDNGAATDAGAVSFGSFGSPTYLTVGVVSANNSLVGSSANDQVGSGGVTTIGSTAYVIHSPLWDNGAATDAGAVSFGSFGSPTYLTVGVVSANNSLVGSSANDQVGSGGVTTIGSTAYVIHSPLWDNGAATDAGAVTFGTSSYGFAVGLVSAANSLVGSSANDQVGSGGVTTVGTTAFVVRSPLWDNGAATDAGAVSFGTSSYGFGIGLVSAANSLVGSAVNDQVGSGGINTIGTTAFVVRSPLWDNGAATDAGAVTFGTSSYGFGIGPVSAANSLVGSHPNDQIGSGGITLQGTTAYIVSSPNWCYGASATTTASSTFGIVGVVSSANSVTGVENALPQISIEQPAMTIIPNGGNRNFGEVSVGSVESLIFSIKNTGTDDLLLTGAPRVVVTGTDAQQFTVTVQPPPMIVTGDSATVVVRFQPTSIGVKSALISISNNVSNQSSFQINLSGMGSIPISAWRQTFFGSAANSGDGHDMNDYDQDGLLNITEYAFGLNPVQNNSGQLPQGQLTGGNFGFSFTEPAGVTGITYGAEWSATMAANDWHAIPDTGTKPQHIFSVPVGSQPRLFIRLRVSSL